MNCRLNRGNIDIKKNNVLKFKGEIEMTLDELPQGKTADVTVVGGEGPLRQHFLDMGLIPGAEVTFIKFAPLGDPWSSWSRAMNSPFAWKMQRKFR